MKVDEELDENFNIDFPIFYSSITAAIEKKDLGLVDAFVKLLTRVKCLKKHQRRKKTLLLKILNHYSSSESHSISARDMAFLCMQDWVDGMDKDFVLDFLNSLSRRQRLKIFVNDIEKFNSSAIMIFETFLGMEGLNVDLINDLLKAPWERYFVVEETESRNANLLVLEKIIVSKDAIEVDKPRLDQLKIMIIRNWKRCNFTCSIDYFLNLDPRKMSYLLLTQIISDFRDPKNDVIEDDMFACVMNSSMIEFWTCDEFLSLLQKAGDKKYWNALNVIISKFNADGLLNLYSWDERRNIEKKVRSHFVSLSEHLARRGTQAQSYEVEAFISYLEMSKEMMIPFEDPENLTDIFKAVFSVGSTDFIYKFIPYIENEGIELTARELNSFFDLAFKDSINTGELIMYLRYLISNDLTIYLPLARKIYNSIPLNFSQTLFNDLSAFFQSHDDEEIQLLGAGI